MDVTKPIGILYEHPEWFIPLFAELDRRGLPYTPITADAYAFDPAERTAPYALVVNRVSPSSYLREHGSAIFQTQSYLAYLEAIGVPIVNGADAYALETSKARQYRSSRGWISRTPAAGSPIIQVTLPRRRRSWTIPSSSSRTSAAVAH